MCNIYLLILQRLWAPAVVLHLKWSFHNIFLLIFANSTKDLGFKAGFNYHTFTKTRTNENYLVVKASRVLNHVLRLV